MKQNYNSSTYVVESSSTWNSFSHKSKAILVFTLLFTFLGFSDAFGQILTDNTPGGTEVINIPTGVTSISLELWGAGGGGQGVAGNPAAGAGGSGGGYVRSNYNVTSGNYNYFVGTGGTGGVTGTNGTASWFVNNTTFNAVGGNGAGVVLLLNSTNGTAPAPPSTGNIGGSVFSTYGGRGANGLFSSPHSGGGGSSAGSTASGNAITSIGGIAPTDGYAGANGLTARNPGLIGGIGAGGSGGLATNNTDYNGGNGGSGQIRINYIRVTSITPNPVCTGNTITITGSNFATIGTTTVTINGTLCTGVNVVNATTITAVVSTGTTTGTVVISNPNGTNNGNTITVNPSPAVIAGGSATVCVGATTPAFTNAAGGGTWSITNGTGSATISAGGVVTGVTAGTATVVYSIGTCTATTAITIFATPTITANPVNASTNVGGAASFTVTANNTPTGYTWQVSTDGGGTWTTVTNGGVYSNATTATLNITGATLAMSGYRYRASATNGCGTSAYSASATLIVTLTYCTPVGVNSTFSISNVTFAGINNNSAVLVNVAGPDYEDFSAIVGNVTAGQTYNISVTSSGLSPNLFYQYVYFDWNNNGNFTDDGGAYTIGTYTTNTATLNLNIQIPVTAFVGTIRMRVGNSFNAVYDPCITAGGNFQFEDYSLTIAPAPVCIEPTGQPTVLVLTPGATSINGSFTAASPVPQNYLVVMNSTGTAPTGSILDGTTYSIGSSIGIGNTVIDTDTNTTFTAGGLNTTSTYYFFIYSMNALCTGGPLYNTNPTVLIGNATTVGAPTAPCTPATTLGQNDDRYINRVAFIGTIVETNNTSTFSNATPGYQDFTGIALKAQQAQGEGVNMIVESTGGRVTIRVWVDWNKNGIFELSERVFADFGAGISSTYGFIIPSGTVPGDYRIRVRTYNSFYGFPMVTESFGYDYDACETFNTRVIGGDTATEYGEAEDYLFTVIQRCDANIVSVIEAGVCGSGIVDLTANGTTGTTQIRWYDALTGGTLVGTSTNGGVFETPNIGVSTTFYCTAWNGSCESLVRTPVVAGVIPTPLLTFAQSAPSVCGEDSIVSLTASGDKEMTNLVYERFEGGLGSFTNVNSDPSAPGIKAESAWMQRASTYIPTGSAWKPAISSGLAPNSFALATSDTSTQPETLIQNSLLSGTLNSTNYLNLTMTMKFYYSRYFPDGMTPADEFVSIQISTNGGGAWTTLQTFTADTGIGTKFAELSYNLNAYINQANLRVRILHNSLASVTGSLPDGVAVDDIRIFGEVPSLAAFVWTGTPLPAAFIDGAATIPYTTGTPVVTVYIKPTVAQLELGTYNFTATAVLANGCSVSQNIALTNTSKIWKGGVDNNWYNTSNWSPAGVPDATTCVIIPDIATTSNRPSEINTVGSSAFGKTLIVKSNGVLKLYSNNNLTIGETITVAPTGLIDMENSSNLVQILNVANTGNINMKRTASVRRQDYVYWSTPVASFASSAVSPGTSSGFQYKWLPTTGGVNGFGNWTLANETMVLGKGYCLRAPNTFDVSTAANYTASFIGVPNNGNITVPISRGTYDGANYSTVVSTTPGTRDDDNWNLVGNPYPSAINAIKFLTLNTNIAGFVNIWTHGTLPSNATIDPFYSNYVSNYTATDYITYNSTGTSTPLGFNGFIGAGQGFFISMLHTTAATTENLIFNNDLRRDIPTGNTYNNSQFFRTTNAEENSSADAVALESHRIWFDLVSSSGTTARSLLGYVENATNEKDRLFDAFSNEKLSFNIFSLIDEEQMLIQGRKLPFDVNDKVNIGVRIPQDGLYKIAIGSVDGMFLEAGQNIYLEDKLLNIIFNLKEAPYSFIGNKGVITDRFVIRYSKDTLASANITEVTNQFNVYDNNVLTAESGKLKIKNIQIFDVLGKELLSKNNVNNNTYQVTTLNRTNSLMIVKVTLEDNTEEVRKVIY